MIKFKFSQNAFCKQLFKNNIHVIMTKIMTQNNNVHALIFNGF